MTRTTMLALFSVLAIGLLIPAYAATNDTLSPLKQMKMGVPIDEIQCNDNKILMQSSSGKPACLRESTVSKLSDRGFTIVVLKENISIESNVELSKTVWNSKDFVNPNKDETSSIAQKQNAPFPSISTEIPSQVRIGEEFTVIVHLDFSPNEGRSFNPDFSHNKMGLGFPGQFELISTDVPILDERISTLDWYNQTRINYAFELPYTGEITYDVELVLRMNEPLFYGDEKLGLTQASGYHDHSKWYLSTTNDVLTISPQPLFVSGSDDSKFPDRYKKPIYHGIKEPFTPGAGPIYDNLNSLPKDVQDGLQRFFQHNYNMTAPQSNPSTMSPEIKAQYQAWLESITVIEPMQ